MSNQIRLDPQVKTDLDNIRGKGETFSQVVERLIDLWRALNGLEPILRSQAAYQEFLKGRQDIVKEAIGDRRDLEARTLSRD